MAECTNGEKMLTEMVFNALGMDDENLEMDFADSGNEIFVKDATDGRRYTIKVTEG